MPSRTALLATALLLLFCCITGLRCPDCGHHRVPYPLSTGPTCGDQSYKVRCSKDTLWFDMLNGSSYAITTVDAKNQRLVIRPPGFKGDSCVSIDYPSWGMWLDEGGPFNISSHNTILKFNCSDLALGSSMNCSSSSICHRYIEENAAVGARCRTTPICCAYTGGGSQNNHRINITPIKCRAYTSFIGLSLYTNELVDHWPEPALEIQWAKPKEPTCAVDLDCKGLLGSSCLLDRTNGQRRCQCNPRRHWDPVNGICAKVRCESRHCRQQRKQKQLIKGIAYAAGSTLALSSFAILVFMRHRRIKREERKLLVKQRQEILNANNHGKSAKLFTAKEIKRATNNFSQENLIGSGGFGEVFKGTLCDGTLTAIKRAKHGNTKGTEQVLNEVRVLCQVNHCSLVRLLGCCVELEHPALVYEYVPNGSLFDHLYRQSRLTLLWKQRLNIALMTAEGLAYLHFSAVPPIFHRDIKSSNILLNEKLEAKVSDFGLSRLVDTEATHISTCAQGTLGYLDPQYYRLFQLTDKSDVYSFGVVLLELLTSKKAIDFSRDVEDVSLVAYIRKMVNKERLMDVVDPTIREKASAVEMETMKSIGNLAMACLDEQRQNRPTMREVVEEIQYILHVVTNLASKT